MSLTPRALCAATAVSVLAASCSGGPVEGADDAVALVRGTTSTTGTSLDVCLDKAGYDIKDAASLADDVETRTFGNGEEFHLVTTSSSGDKIRFTVVTDRGFVFAHDDASAALLEKAGCPLDGEPLNEKTT